MKEARLFQNLSRLLKGEALQAPLASPQAFSALYERTYLPVYRYIFGLHGGPVEDVEDLTAETFARAWKARHTYRGDPHSAIGWLLGIAKRLVIDNYRRRSARIQPEEALLEAIPLDELTPESHLVAYEQFRTLSGLLESLPGEQREMLVLRYFLGWRVSQIGKYLQIPENTVSVTIRRTLARLQRDWPLDKE